MIFLGLTIAQWLTIIGAVPQIIKVLEDVSPELVLLVQYIEKTTKGSKLEAQLSHAQNDYESFIAELHARYGQAD